MIETNIKIWNILKHIQNDTYLIHKKSMYVIKNFQIKVEQTGMLFLLMQLRNLRFSTMSMLSIARK